MHRKMNQLMQGATAHTRSKSSSSFSDMSSDESKKMLKTRELIAREIYSTEDSYVSSLSLIVTMYCYELKQKQIVSEDHINIIFSNVELIWQTHIKFLKELEERLGPPGTSPLDQCVGELFSEYAPFFRFYKIYVKNHDEASQLIKKLLETNSKFKKFVEGVFAKPQSRGLSLESFMIMPIQRIPR